MKTRWISAFALLVLVSCAPSRSVDGKLPTASPAEGAALAVATQALTSALPERPLQLLSTPEASEMTPLPTDQDKLVDLAKQDLADRLKIDASQIALLSTMEITWPDISAGCTTSAGQILSKGRVYGYSVWLGAKAAEYLYHVGQDGQVFPCTEPNPGANNPLLMTPGGPTQDPNNRQP